MSASTERGFTVHQKSKKIKKKGGRAPKYQNKFAFRHNKNSKKTKLIAGISQAGLCIRCVQIIQWRKDFRKYKVLKQPKKCSKCFERKISLSYHILCRDCSTELGVCAKCKKPGRLSQDKPAELSYDEVHQKLSNYRESDKRAIIRELERGALNSDDIEALQQGASGAPSKPSEEDSLPSGPLIPSPPAPPTPPADSSSSSPNVTEEKSEDVPMED